MGSTKSLEVLILACIILHVHSFESTTDSTNEGEVCDRLDSRLKSCLAGMTGFEQRFHKKKLAQQGVQDQIVGCIRRKVREEQMMWLCEGAESEDLLVGCIDESLKDHSTFILRSRITRFTKGITACLKKKH
ncbi:hypothetical protein V5799_026628 [Amblyomma americanum]|uniref:Secreted protein n=1 Tax=Amblyomma americanum TaxID=6943 RepID=A0AAQ4DI16_AMBAM